MKGHFWYRVPLNTKSDHRAFLHKFRFTLDCEWLYPPGSIAHKAHGGSAAPTGINFQGSLCGPGRSTQLFFHEELHRRLVHCCPSPECQGWQGEARADVCSPAVPHEAAGDGEAMCGSYGVARRRRAEAPEGRAVAHGDECSAWCVGHQTCCEHLQNRGGHGHAMSGHAEAHSERHFRQCFR